MTQFFLYQFRVACFHLPIALWLIIGKQLDCMEHFTKTWEKQNIPVDETAAEVDDATLVDGLARTNALKLKSKSNTADPRYKEE